MIPSVTRGRARLASGRLAPGVSGRPAPGVSGRSGAEGRGGQTARYSSVSGVGPSTAGAAR